MKHKIHLDYLDLAKGIGIMTVILGHGMFPNHFLIDSFHMPLFFILTGLTFTPPNGLNANSKEWVLKKTESIFVPYIFFMIISGCIEAIVGRINPSSPFNSPLWFLQTLFCALLLYYMLTAYLSRRIINIVCCIIALATLFVYKYTDIPSVMPFSLVRALVAMVFIHIGFLLSKTYMREQHGRSIVTYGTILLVVFGMAFYASVGNFHTVGLNFCTGSIFTYNIALPWVLAVSGSIFVLFASKFVEKVKLLNWMGRNSLVIMCVHFPLIERLNVWCSTLDAYQSVPGKLMLALCSYVVTIAFSCAMVCVCKRIVPQLTGYGGTFLTKIYR